MFSFNFVDNLEIYAHLKLEYTMSFRGVLWDEVQALSTYTEVHTLRPEVWLIVHLFILTPWPWPDHKIIKILWTWLKMFKNSLWWVGKNYSEDFFLYSHPIFLYFSIYHSVLRLFKIIILLVTKFFGIIYLVIRIWYDTRTYVCIVILMYLVTTSTYLHLWSKTTLIRSSADCIRGRFFLISLAQNMPIINKKSNRTWSEECFNNKIFYVIRIFVKTLSDSSAYVRWDILLIIGIII